MKGEWPLVLELLQGLSFCKPADHIKVYEQIITELALVYNELTLAKRILED